MALSPRQELYVYLYSLYRITPTPCASVAAFVALVQEHRAGAAVQRELLAAIAPILGGLASQWATPGDLVSDFWMVVNEKKVETPKDIGAALRDLKKIERKSVARAELRHDAYQEHILGTAAKLREELPAWFVRLPQETQVYLWETVIEEEKAEERAERLETNAGTERSTKSRLFAELRKMFATDFPGLVPLSNEPRATPNKPSARGSKGRK